MAESLPDATAARRVAHACVQASREFWRIDQGWEVDVSFSKLENGTAGECIREIAYRRAWIHIDLHQVDDLADVWRVTAHEMLHVVVAEFDVFRHSVASAKESFNEFAWDFAEERTVTQLEGVFLRERPYPDTEPDPGLTD